jgi:cytosine deaminase
MEGRSCLAKPLFGALCPDDEFARTCDHILALDLGVTTLPAANPYIQGRGQEVLPPRGLTPSRRLRAPA